MFFETVHWVNRAHYSEHQVHAWAPPLEQWDMPRWRARLAAQSVVVAAEESGEIVGFCSWEPKRDAAARTAYLDMLFVHRAWQRRGVAAALYTEAERTMRAREMVRVQTHASVTAQPFFARQGFTLVKHQTVHVRGVDLPNAVMEKRLDQT